MTDELLEDYWSSSDFLFIDGPFLGRSAESAIVRAAMRTPGTLTVLSGPRGIGKAALIGDVQLGDSWGRGGGERRQHKVVHLEGGIGGVGDSVRRYFQKEELPAPAIPTSESFARAFEEHLQDQNVVVVVTDVTLAELLAGRVPIVRGKARTFLTTRDGGLAARLIAQGHRDVQHLEIGPLADADLANLDERSEAERDGPVPEATANLIHCALLTGGYPWSIRVLARITEPDEEGGVVDIAGLSRRLVAATDKFDADGLPLSARVVAEFAAAQLTPLARLALAWWVASGSPLTSWRWTDDDEEAAYDLIHVWGLAEDSDAGLHPAVIAVVRGWPEYRAAMASAPAVDLLRHLHEADLPRYRFANRDWPYFHQALTVLLERGQFDIVARVLRVFWLHYARIGLQEWLVDWSTRLLPRLSPGRDTAGLRAWLGKSHLALQRPDLALGHLRRAIVELQALPAEDLGSSQFFDAKLVAQDGRRRLVVLPVELDDLEPLDCIGWGKFADLEWSAQQADAALDFGYDSADRFLPNEDMLTIARADYALAQAELGEAERAWREISLILQDIRLITLHEWRARALENAAQIAVAVNEDVLAEQLSAEAGAVRLLQRPVEAAPDAEAVVETASGV